MKRFGCLLLCLVLCAAGVGCAAVPDADTTVTKAESASDKTAEYTALSFLTPEQAAAFDAARRYRAAWYGNAAELRELYPALWEEHGPTRTLTGLQGEVMEFLFCTPTEDEIQDDLRAVLSVSLYRQFLQDAQTEYRIVREDGRLLVNEEWCRSKPAALQLPEELRGKPVRTEEELVEFELLPEAWESHATQPVRVVMEKNPATETWRVTAWPAPDAADRWQPAVQAAPAQTLGGWDGGTWVWENGTLRGVAPDGSLLWERAEYALPLPVHSVSLSAQESDGGPWVFAMGADETTVYAADGTGTLARYTVGQTTLRYQGHRVDTTGRWAIFTFTDGMTDKTCQLRFDLQNGYWQQTDADGMQHSVADSDVQEVLACDPTGSWLLCRTKAGLPDTGPEGSLVLWHTQNGEKTVLLGDWTADTQTGFLKNGDVYVMRSDSVTFRSAAADYTETLPFAMRFGGQADGSSRYLHTFRRDPFTLEFYVAYSVESEDTYRIVHCDTAGAPVTELNSGVAVQRTQAGVLPTVLTLRGEKLYLMTEDTTETAGRVLTVLDVSTGVFIENE